jgi:hypothetical protein
MSVICMFFHRELKDIGFNNFEFINELCPCCNLRQGGHTVRQAVECGLPFIR